MPTRRRWTLKASFAHFGGAKATNPRWSWSAKSPRGKTVVVTIWRHDLDPDGEQEFPRSKIPNRERKKPGFSDRKRNLIWADDHCRGQFRVVINVKQKKEKGTGIAYCFPCKKLVMHIKQLDDDTGEFRAVGVCAKRPCACASA
jgi:hypothetical protein